MKRKPLSKRTRFEVFKRDGFACQYCGRTPPSVLLEIDHVVPVAEGGTDVVHNLVTACFDCNRGKAAVPLSEIPESLKEAAERAEERRAQIKAMDRLARAERRRENKAIDEIEAVLLDDPDLVYKDSFRRSIRHFIKSLPLSEVYSAAEIAAAKFPEGGRRDKYFCGVCWKKIRESEA